MEHVHCYRRFRSAANPRDDNPMPFGVTARQLDTDALLGHSVRLSDAGLSGRADGIGWNGKKQLLDGLWISSVEDGEHR